MDIALTMISSTMMSIMHSKKNCWCCLRVFASLVFGNSLKTSFILIEVHKTMYGNNENVQKKFFDNLYPKSDLRDITFAVLWNILVADENRSVNWPSMNWTPHVARCSWNNMLASMQYQLWCMLSDFSYASNHQSSNLDRTTWLRRITWLKKQYALFIKLKLHQTMDQVWWLGLSLYFHSAMLVTTSWSCLMPLGHHLFHFKSLFWPPVLVPSHPGPATFHPCWAHSLVLTWFP